MKYLSSKPKCKRGGGVLIEAVIASALLVTATSALAKIVVSSERLGTAANQRLAARLVTENAIERLSLVSAEEWQQQADPIAKAVSETSGILTTIEMKPFQIGDRDAWHAIIYSQVGSSQTTFQENHAWKVVQ